MSTSPSTVLAAAFTVAAAVYGALHLLLHTTQDAREPPPVPASVPFISSVIGLSRKKTRYYTELQTQYNLPIYTIRLPGARLYVVNSTSLIPAVQRQYKTLAFPPLEAKLAMNICGSSKTANDILLTNVNGEEGPWGYSITHYKALHPALSPGPGLDAMNRVMAQKVASSLERIKKPKSTKLFEFIRDQITFATTESVYGEANPFRDPVIVDSFWKFQSGLMGLLMGGLPSLLARDSVLARDRISDRFLQYFKAGSHHNGSALIKARYEHSVEHKIPIEDIAKFEAAGAVAILTNTSPASFWLVYHIFSNPIALADCRNELSGILSEGTIKTEGGQIAKEITIDMSQVKSSCPVMLSSLQEVLRLHSVGISTRLVMEDHMLDDRFLLKKDATIMIPGPVQHKNTAIWGDDVESFNHRRFLPKERRHNPIAFRAFGGGTTLCPGRHFASTEILTFTALLLLRFDMLPAGGKWKHMTTDKAGLWEVTPIPDEDIEIELVPRDDDYKDAKWRVLITDTDKSMPISAEDVDAE